MPSTNPVDYGADPCGLRNSAWAINECLNTSGKCEFPVGTFLIGSPPGAKITQRSRVGGIASFTTATPHGLVVGEKITLYGFTDPTFNGVGPTYYGFKVESTPSATTFTATVPGPDSPLVVQDGWINYIGGGFNSSIILGYQAAVDNLEIRGQGVKKTVLKFADHTSTKRGDLYGFSVQMIKTIGTRVGFGVVGAPGSQAGVPTDATNCKNTIIEGITFDGNYANNSVEDVKITSVQRTNGINTYTTDRPLYELTDFYSQFYAVAPPTYTPPLPPLYTNVSNYNQYISGVVTAGPGDDASFVGYGKVVNLTANTFQRDLRVVLLHARRNPYNTVIFTRHPQFYFPFTIGDTFTVTGFTNPIFNGSFTVAGFLSIDECYCTSVGPTTGLQLNGFERNFNVATYDTAVPHGFVGGESLLIEGLSDPSFNGVFTVSGIPAPNQFNCVNVGTNIASTPDLGYAYDWTNQNARAWSAPDVLPTAQVFAGVNSVFTVAGINHTGEKALIQDNEFFDYGVGTLNAESFIVKTFLPMTVPDDTPGAIVRRNFFGYQGSNSLQGTLFPGSAEAITEVVLGGYSAIINPINIASRSANVATFTCVMKHTLRVGDAVKQTMTSIAFVQRAAGIAQYTTAGRHFASVGASVAVGGIWQDVSFNGNWTVASIIDDNNFTVVQAGPIVAPLAVVGSLYVISTVTTTPDDYKFTVNAPGPNILPGLYLDGFVIMVRSRRIFASECVIEDNTFRSGPNRQDQQSPLHATTVRETKGAEVRTNDFNGYIGTCFYVDSFHHYGTHIHQNLAKDVCAFIALTVQDWYTLYAPFGGANPEIYSTFTSAHHDMVIENNDVALTGPNSWFYQPGYPAIDAVFLINTHDVNKSKWYYPTDYQIPITSAARVLNVTTFTTASPHELQTGMKVTVLGALNGTFNGQFIVASVPLPTAFTVYNAGAATTTTGGVVGINTPIQFPWEIRPIGFQRTAGVATYTTNKAHQLAIGYHATVEGFSDATFNDEVIVTGTPTLYTFTCASPGPDVPFTSEVGNFFRYVENIQIGCNTVSRLSGNGLVVNNGGNFGPFFISGRSTGCVAPLDQFFYFDCPEGCLALECDPGPCKPNDYLYRI